MAAEKKDDLLSNLARQPTDKKIMILVGVMAAMGLLYWQFFLSGLSEDAKAQKGQNASLKSQQAKASQELRKLKKSESQGVKLDILRKRLERILPYQADLKSLEARIQRAANDSGLTIASLDSKNKDTKEFDDIRKSHLKVKASGEFYQLVKFFVTLAPRNLRDPQKALNALERKEKAEAAAKGKKGKKGKKPGPKPPTKPADSSDVPDSDDSETEERDRIVTIENLIIRSDDEKPYELEVEFVAATFSQIQSEADRKKAEAERKKAAKADEAKQPARGKAAAPTPAARPGAKPPARGAR